MGGGTREEKVPFIRFQKTHKETLDGVFICSNVTEI